MSIDIESGLSSYVSQALELRMGAAMPDLDASPGTVLAALHDVRQRLDRVEELYASVLLLKSGVQRSAAAATAAADDAWDTALHTARTASVKVGGEFTSAKERYAEANLATLDLRREARRVNDLAQLCQDKAEVLRLIQRGLDGLRHDILTSLRTLAFESHLER